MAEGWRSLDTFESAPRVRDRDRTLSGEPWRRVQVAKAAIGVSREAACHDAQPF